MLRRRPNPRLAATLSISAVLVTSAGAIAMVAERGVFVASIILTSTLLITAAGVAYASDRRLGLGVAALLAAALPLFLVFHVIGLAILRSLGPAVAGGLLIGLGGLLACTAIWMWFALDRTRPSPHS